jgi:hypothetical protein
MLAVVLMAITIAEVGGENQESRTENRELRITDADVQRGRQRVRVLYDTVI